MVEQKKKYIELRQQRDFGQIISTTFDFLFSNFASFFKTVFAITGVAFVLSMAVLSLWMYKFFGSLLQGTRNYSRYSGASNSIENILDGYNLVYLIVGFAILLVAVMLTYITIYCYMKIYVRLGRIEEISISQVWFEVKSNFLRYLAAGFLYSVFLIVFYAIVMFSITLSGFVFTFLMFGFIALVYYFYLYFNVVINEEEMRIIDAFSRSFNLVKGHWWLTFGVYFVSYLLCYVVTLLLGLAATVAGSAASTLFDMRDVQFLLWPLGISVSVLGVIYVYMVFCFFIIKNCVLYYSLVESKDNTGLLQKIQAISNSTNEGNNEVKIERNNQQYSNDEPEEEF